MENKVYSNENRMDISDIHKRVLGDNKAYIDDKVLIVDECSIDEGIEARVVSAFMVNEKEMCVIFTLRDVTGENRLTKGSCITRCSVESENIQCHSGSSYGLIEIDEKTNTAIYSINAYSEEGFDGNIIFKLNNIGQFMSGLKSDVIENIDIYAKLEKHKPKIISQTEINQCGGSFGDSIKYEDFIKLDLLKPDEMSIPFENIDWAKISNIGFVDGVFHIQVKLFLDRKNIGFMSINIGDYRSTADIHFYKESEFDHKARLGYVYQEYICNDINDISQLKNSVVKINYTEGVEDIPVSFTFEFAKPDKLTSIDIEKNIDVIVHNTEVIVDEMWISPRGLVLLCKSYEEIFSKHDVTDDVYIVYKNGDKVKLERGHGSGQTGDNVHYIRTSFVGYKKSAISMDGIDKVVINGSVFELE